MASLRLLAISGTTDPSFDRKVMDWHDVVMGQTEIISNENERKALIMLQKICQQAKKEINQEMTILSVSRTYKHSMQLLAHHVFYRKYQRHVLKQTITLLHCTFHGKYGTNQKIL